MTTEMAIRDLLPADAQTLGVHPAFWEVAVGTVRVITAVQTKYRAAGEREAVLTTHILWSLATCLATVAVRHGDPADADTRGSRLVDHIADGVFAALAPATPRQD